LARVFDLLLLNKYRVNYYRCLSCGSLQTEPPFWLEEAYDRNLSWLDTAAAQRTLNNLAASYAVCRILGLKHVVDFGGSDGLLCRLLRDYSIDCYVRDRYAEVRYAQGFEDTPFERPDLTLAFEVLEHLPNPCADLGDVFAGDPPVVLASTMAYCGEDAAWTYLAPESGQHVFFYSERALRMIAAQRGYDAYREGLYVLFCRPEIRRARLARRSLRKTFIRLTRLAMNVLPASGVMRDQSELRRRASPTSHGHARDPHTS
jgi:hypothetical protein